MCLYYSISIHCPIFNVYFETSICNKNDKNSFIPLENRCTKIRLCNLTNHDWKFKYGTLLRWSKERDSVYVKSGFIREGEHLYVVPHVMCSYVIACNDWESLGSYHFSLSSLERPGHNDRPFWNSLWPSECEVQVQNLVSGLSIQRKFIFCSGI